MAILPILEFKNRLIGIINLASIQDKNLDKFRIMLLDNSNYLDSYPTNPKSISNVISSIGEPAFQRAILSSFRTLLDYKRNSGFETIFWMDGELPVIFSNKSRRRSVDLIGYLDESPCLCELKYYSENKTDNPYYAVIELLTYYCFIQFNATFLDHNKVHHQNGKDFNWIDFKNNDYPYLIVCANKSYWEYWFKKIDKSKYISAVSSWGKLLETNIELFQTEDFNFKSQKGNGTYTPNIPNDSILEIVR